MAPSDPRCECRTTQLEGVKQAKIPYGLATWASSRGFQLYANSAMLEEI
jgi:hypothetical protein